jgi:hypothetical protein
MLTMGFITDPEHWRQRAEDMRLTARSLMDENAKARMLKIAEGYEALRRQTEERVAKEPAGSVSAGPFRGLPAHFRWGDSDWPPAVRD